MGNIRSDNLSSHVTDELSSHSSSLVQRLESDGANVAVIAIHGVGQHPSGVSADAVATLLMSIGRNGADRKEHGDRAESHPKAAPPYTGFLSTSIDVPLRPVQSPPAEARTANDRNQVSLLSKLWGIFDERRGYLAATRGDADYEPIGYKLRELRPNEPDRGEYGYQFMLTQVAGYRGEVDRNFETIRLEGKRTPSSPAATVHIYDAHYSDLTKPESNILSFFLAFYQLLIHLASLSLLAVYWAEAENVREHRAQLWRWRVGSSVHATSVRLLVMWVPILNLVLLGITCCAFIDKTNGRAALPVLSCLLAAVLSLLATLFLLWKSPSPSRPFLWATIPLLGMASGTLVLSALACFYTHSLHLDIPFWRTLLLFDCLLTAGFLIGLVGKIFDPLRPGAFFLSITLYVANVLLFLFYLLPSASNTSGVGQNQVATASLWAAQWIFGELSLAWLLCLFFALLSWPLSALCVHGIKNDGPRKARAIAAFRTGRFAFAVPSILFMTVTCALWSGVLVSGSGRLKAFDKVEPEVGNSGPSSQRVPSLIIPKICAVERWIHNTKAGSQGQLDCPPKAGTATEERSWSGYWSDYLTGLLLVSVTPGLPLTIGLFSLSLLLLTWAVLPSILYEAKPEWVIGAQSDRIRSLGEWLSRGLDNTAILTRLLWFAIVPVPLFFYVFDWLHIHEVLQPEMSGRLVSASKLTLPLIQWEGLVLAVSAAAIFGFILKYLTTVLDTILDVDNYLRISPQDKTPRARIAERCTSLLRYIAAFRDKRGRPYSKVIIVAHSLGSMVTTDLLRYLERSAVDSPDPGLAPYGFRRGSDLSAELKLPIYVFSMGCPLRQLLNRFFPHLYWWISDVPDNSLAFLGDPAPSPIPAIITHSLPRIDEMNVTRWCNAYRSGDYVGRSLWVGQWLVRNANDDPSQPPDLSQDKIPRKYSKYEEMCIGLGAHTHYWDRSAPDVAELLDQLIL
jgi:hypothetical protein